MNKQLYSFKLSTLAQLELEKIEDTSTRESIIHCVEKLVENPDRRGKRLRKGFRGFYRIKAVKGLYRIIYRIDFEQAVVEIFFLGIRSAGSKSDVYNVGLRAIKELEQSNENLQA